MLLAPGLAVTRFAQLQPGDLFILPYEEGGFVALKVSAPDGDMLMVPIGPSFPDGLPYPCLVAEPASTVISLGKKYALRLPTRPEGWRLAPPGPQIHCIAVTEEGAFVRASFVPPEDGYKPCYIALETGAIVTAGSGRLQPYVAPRGPLAFAVEWELLTQEAKPQRILACPW
jgi:hypothetical protein